jgi:phage terminase large subunit-like protein
MRPEGGSLFASIADAIESDWQAIARPEQLPPTGDWGIWLILAGRGAGKTRAGAEWVRSLAEAATVSRIALVGPTAADVRDTMVEGESGLLAIAPNSNRPIYEPSKRRLTWSNGVQATLFSSEEPERLRGPQHGAAWCDELCSWRNVRDAWDNLQFGLRLGKRPRQVITTTPKPVKLLKEIVKRDGQDVVVTRGRTSDNAANLAPSFLSQIVSRYEGTRLGRQELNAEILEDVQGALWTRELIEEGRRDKSPPMRRIVVAIDPAVSVSESSDETGLIVAGLGEDGHGYVLEMGAANSRRSNGRDARSHCTTSTAPTGSSRRRTRAARWSKQPSAQLIKTSASRPCMRAAERSRGRNRSRRWPSSFVFIWSAGFRNLRISSALSRRASLVRRTVLTQWCGPSQNSWSKRPDAQGLSTSTAR